MDDGGEIGIIGCLDVQISDAEGPSSQEQHSCSLQLEGSLGGNPTSNKPPMISGLAQTDAGSTCASVGDETASQAMVTVATATTDAICCDDHDCAGLASSPAEGPGGGDYLRPILVGYAFGPKKMSTMGIIMAEASKALSTVTMAAVPVGGGSGNSNGRDETQAGRRRLRQQRQQAHELENASGYEEDGHAESSVGKLKLPRLTTAALEHNARDGHGDGHEDGGGGVVTICEESSIASLNNPAMSSTPHQHYNQHADSDSQMTVAGAADENVPAPAAAAAGSSGIRFSIAGGPNGDGAGGIRNIIRFFQSSCSSAASFADSSITTAATASACAGPNNSNRPQSPSCSSTVMSMKGYASIGAATTCSSGGGFRDETKAKDGQLLQAVRVSFVPLDLDSPLEEQHGGKFDAILHKMTEDILCLSKMSRTHSSPALSSLSSTLPSSSQVDSDELLNDVQRQARQRVGNLEKYKRDHQACCLVDHPSYVQALMSRSDIAHILSRCLVGVTTRSGVPVGTPRFEVVGDDNNNKINNHPDFSYGSQVENLIDGAPFTYPIIVKPLPAAGTAASHRMVVVLNRHGLRRIHFPCLLQEYANHDGILYKVYVLGDTVRVFPRNSLPNLPRGECAQQGEGRTGYVEFDSQRPYPRLSDFGVASGQQQPPNKGSNYHEPNNQSPFHKKRRVTYTSSVGSRDASPHNDQERIKGKLANAKLVTADEIRPVASALRKAFGLELFGFDILVTNRRGVGETSTQGDKEMLVVDVNYFPSYKEVSNFPSLLAQYLTQRAVEGRMRSVNSR